MESIVFLLCLQWFIIELVMARLELELNFKTCGTSYNLETAGEAYITYNAEQAVDNECVVKFINYASFTRQTCVKPLNFKLDCNTIVEYHRILYSKHLTPEKVYTCHNATFKTWCGPKRTAYFYLVFKGLRRVVSTDQSIHMKVYLRDFQGEGTSSVSRSSSSGSSIAVILSITIVVFVIVFIIAFRIIHQRRMQNSFPRTPYTYQTSSRQMVPGNVSAGQHLTCYQPQQQFSYQPPHQVGYQPVPQTGYHPPPQAPFQPELQGNYQIHKMQSAYPGTTQGNSVPQSAEQTDPPPSYNSVVL